MNSPRLVSALAVLLLSISSIDSGPKETVQDTRSIMANAFMTGGSFTQSPYSVAPGDWSHIVVRTRFATMLQDISVTLSAASTSILAVVDPNSHQALFLSPRLVQFANDIDWAYRSLSTGNYANASLALEDASTSILSLGAVPVGDTVMPSAELLGLYQEASDELRKASKHLSMLTTGTKAAGVARIVDICNAIIAGPAAIQLWVDEVLRFTEMWQYVAVGILSTQDLEAVLALPTTTQDTESLAYAANVLGDPELWVEELVTWTFGFPLEDVGGALQELGLHYLLMQQSAGGGGTTTASPDLCVDECTPGNGDCKKCELCDVGIGGGGLNPDEDKTWKGLIELATSLPDLLPSPRQLPALAGRLWQHPTSADAKKLGDEFKALIDKNKGANPTLYIKVCWEKCEDVWCPGPLSWFTYVHKCVKKEGEWVSVPCPKTITYPPLSQCTPAFLDRLDPAIDAAETEECKGK